MLLSLLDNEKLNIIPIKKDSKIPSIRWGDFQNLIYPRDKLKNHNGNFAVVCGGVSGGLVVLDLDNPDFYTRELRDIDTLTVKSPRGYHLYFFSDCVVGNRHYSGFDVLGNRCYVLIPPSVVDGKCYSVVKDRDILFVPDFDLFVNSLMGCDIGSTDGFDDTAADGVLSSDAVASMPVPFHDIVDDDFLDKIVSDVKRFEVMDVLRNVSARNEQRCWLVGFLKFVGYSLPDILCIISEFNCWSDYNERTTLYYVKCVYNSGCGVYPEGLPVPFKRGV